MIESVEAHDYLAALFEELRDYGCTMFELGGNERQIVCRFVLPVRDSTPADWLGAEDASAEMGADGL